MIRLAANQGLLSAPSLNRFQLFAAKYVIHMDRARLSEDVEDTLKRLTMYLHPARYDDLYRSGAIDPDVVPVAIDGTPLEEVEGLIGEPIYDTDLVDKYFDDLDMMRETSGAALFSALAGDGEWV